MLGLCVLVRKQKIGEVPAKWGLGVGISEESSFVGEE